MKTEYDLGWGCPIVVRQALAETLGHHFSLSDKSMASMGYPPHLGSPKLIEQLKDLAKRQSGHKPKHLIVTCGATGAINAAIYALKNSISRRTYFVVANKRYYPIYPDIVAVHDLDLIDKNEKTHLMKPENGSVEENFITLVDSPSAPEGLVYPFESVDIHDAAYASKTYGKGGHTPQNYRVMCGSLSKTLGLAGLRLGWASTDDGLLYHRMSQYVTAQNIGLSTLSMTTAEEILSSLDLDRFETRSKNYLDSNREEVQRLLNRFGQGECPSRGMFAIIEMGKAERRALTKANIKWLAGSFWGETDDWARLSLGQTREVVRAAVKAALK